MEFTTIDLEKDRETALKFRREAFRESFGATDSFNEEDYLDWLQKKMNEHPEGIVFVRNNGRPIGQIDLSIREYRGRLIGYVHLFYLEEEWRDRGLGMQLFDYAMRFFHERDITEFHLRVAPGNERAVAFYKKYGMTEAGEELGGKVIRMTGSVDAWSL